MVPIVLFEIVRPFSVHRSALAAAALCGKLTLFQSPCVLSPKTE